MYGLPKNVRVVPVITVCIKVFLPHDMFMFMDHRCLLSLCCFVV